MLITESTPLQNFSYFFSPFYTSVSVLFGVIVCKKQRAWPQLPGEAVFLTSTTCIIRHDFLFERSHCLFHPGGSQIVIPSSRWFPCLYHWVNYYSKYCLGCDYSINWMEGVSTWEMHLINWLLFGILCEWLESVWHNRERVMLFLSKAPYWMVTEWSFSVDEWLWTSWHPAVICKLYNSTRM